MIEFLAAMTGIVATIGYLRGSTKIVGAAVILGIGVWVLSFDIYHSEDMLGMVKEVCGE